MTTDTETPKNYLPKEENNVAHRHFTILASVYKYSTNRI